MGDKPEHLLLQRWQQAFIALLTTYHRASWNSSTWCYFFLNFYCSNNRMWAATVHKALPTRGVPTETAILTVIWLFGQLSDDNILELVWPKSWWMLNINRNPRWKGHFLQAGWLLHGKKEYLTTERVSNLWVIPCSSELPNSWQETFPQAFPGNLPR